MKIPVTAEITKPNAMPSSAVYGLSGLINSEHASMNSSVAIATTRCIGLYTPPTGAPRKFLSAVGTRLTPRMKIIVPVTSAGKNLRSLKVNEPNTKRSTPEKIVMPSTSGTPPISAARIQAERAAESATESD